MDERAVATEKEASGLHSFISDVDELLTESEALLDSFDAVPLGAIPAPSPAASNAQYVAAQLDAGAENENERSGDSSSSPAELEPTAATKPAKKKRSRNSTRDREKAELEFFRKQATELAKEVAALRNERETSAQVGNALAPTWRRLADRQLQGKQKAESESKYLKAMVEENANTMKRLWEILTERSKQSSTHCGVLENEQRRCMEWEDSVVLERLKAELAGAYARTDDVIRESGIGRMLDEGVEYSHTRKLHLKNGQRVHCSELVNTRLLPFDAHIASNAMWHASMNRFFRCSFHTMQQSDDASICSGHQGMEQRKDIFAVKFQRKVHLDGVDVVFDVRQVMQRYKEGARYVLLWLAEYSSNGKNNLSTADTNSIGWVIWKKTPSSYSSSIVGSITQSKVVNIAGYYEDPERSSNILTNSFASSYEVCTDELNMLVENMLLETSLPTNGRLSRRVNHR
ncbi:hypothetical protein FI667_g11568, partial [Globisporangium splendens]